jgi:hypothetical protein
MDQWNHLPNQKQGATINTIWLQGSLPGLSNLCIFSTNEPHLKIIQCRVIYWTLLEMLLLPVCAMIATAKKNCAGGTSVLFGYIPVLVPETGINSGMNTGIKYQTSLVWPKVWYQLDTSTRLVSKISWYQTNTGIYLTIGVQHEYIVLAWVLALKNVSVGYDDLRQCQPF